MSKRCIEPSPYFFSVYAIYALSTNLVPRRENCFWNVLGGWDKMPAREGSRADLAHWSDSLVFCGIPFYDYQVRTINDAAAVCAMTRYSPLFSRNFLSCKKQWKTFLVPSEGEHFWIVRWVCITSTIKRSRFWVVINIWWIPNDQDYH